MPQRGPSSLDYGVARAPSSAGRIALAVALGIVGACFGGLLMGLGFFAAGMGHGSYVVIGLGSSPLGLLEHVFIALFGTPVLWAAVGGALALIPAPAARRTFLALMAIHYIALVPILSDAEHFGDWSYVPRVRGTVIAGFMVYAFGQVAIWLTFLWLHRKPRA